MIRSTEIIIAVVVLILIAAAYFVGRGSVKPAQVVKVERTVDTAYKDRIVDKPVAYPVYYYLRDTIINDIRTTDTVFYSSNSDLPVSGPYEARHDTTAADSSYTLSLVYKSDTPLSVNGFFRYKLNFRERTIREVETIYLEKQKTLWDYIKLSIYTGVGYGVTTQKFDLNIGAGLTITPFQ